MNAFKRLCLFLFGLAGIFAIVALILPWIGPWTRQATEMLTVPWYYITLEACACVAALGCLISLLRALFAPRRVRSVVVDKVGSDQITITTSAISSQTSHIVESRGDFVAEQVRVTATKRAVDVRVRVRPAYALNISEEGTRLHEDLVAGLSELAGDAISSVTLEFVEADSLDPAPEYAAPPAAPHATEAHGAGASPMGGGAASDGGSYEITVPMGHGSASGSDAPAIEAPAVEDAAPSLSEPGYAPEPEPSDDAEQVEEV